MQRTSIVCLLLASLFISIGASTNNCFNVCVGTKECSKKCMTSQGDVLFFPLSEGRNATVSPILNREDCFSVCSGEVCLKSCNGKDSQRDPIHFSNDVTVVSFDPTLEKSQQTLCLKVCDGGNCIKTCPQSQRVVSLTASETPMEIKSTSEDCFSVCLNGECKKICKADDKITLSPRVSVEPLVEFSHSNQDADVFSTSRGTVEVNPSMVKDKSCFSMCSGSKCQRACPSLKNANYSIMGLSIQSTQNSCFKLCSASICSIRCH
eukprot:TRINITY_DN841_c0_g1_i1.p1 TRINITY_DN841_c0_g1~~TRINITY_DN841_c0_g1_i1.p1  ORF type:complete len:264 (+),score=75.96 TRINITY_DN841_c0_g1_i1:241-1032(+)